MIEISGLSKRFGPITAVDDVSFSVGRGEVLGFLGPNGAGKSTTMKMVTGFLTPTAGTIRVCGFDVAETPIEAKSKIGYLPEGAPTYPDMTPPLFLKFVAAVRGFRGADGAKRVARAMELAQLETVAHQHIDTLSKGFKRRVGLAQALIHDPEVLILDEPTDGLDPNQKHEVRSLIREMAPKKSIVISTHLLEEVDSVCSRALVISRGRLVADGTPDALAARARNHNAVSLVVTGVTLAEAQASLSGVDGVAAVEPGDTASADGAAALRVMAVDGKPIAPAISDLVKSRGWTVTEMHVERGRLDDVFRNITREA